MLHKLTLFFLFTFLLISTPALFAAPPSVIKLDTIPAGDALSPLTEVEVDAEFKGGLPAWQQFMAENLDANIPVVKGAPAGTYTVIIQFVVDTNGNVSRIKPLTQWGYGMEAEVIRVIKKSPRWIPAVQYGRPVVAFRKQPITFTITEEKKKRRFF